MWASIASTNLIAPRNIWSYSNKDDDIKISAGSVSISYFTHIVICFVFRCCFSLKVLYAKQVLWYRHWVCDIFGRDWSPSANGRRIYQIVCYKMIPNYYPFSINFIFSTYYPIKHSKYTHPGGVWLAKKTTAGASCVVEKTLKDTYFARSCT